MNLRELDDFRLDDAVKFRDRLNPALFNDEKLKSEVREQLLLIAQDFIDHLGLDDIKVKDITLSGSNAAYTYTDHSDVDVHLLVDYTALDPDEIYRELFNSKKVIYNDSHDIKVRGYDVELYVQDVAEPVKSLGEYSILRDKWIKFPSKRRSNFDELSTKNKFEKLSTKIASVLKRGSIDDVDNLLDKIKKYRQAGLEKHGEFGPENLAFKALRSRGLITKLYDYRDRLHSEQLSLAETELEEEYSELMMASEDYHPNEEPPGPEFRPTMPAGTARVDVSDVYDWYKLGQHISNLKGLGKHDFGKGPPSSIIAFGSEDEEHKYIDDLKKTGLTTTDLDPPGHKKMRGQKTDPTYNVDESASGYIPSAKEKNDPRFKTALTVDVKPDSIQQNADKLGLGKIHRSGVPPTARHNGKVK